MWLHLYCTIVAKRNVESERKGRQHNNRLNKYSKQIDALYEELCAEASRLGVLADFQDDIDKIFSFDDYPTIKKRAEELFETFARKMEQTIISGIDNEWKASVAKNTAMVKQLLAGTTLSSTITDTFMPRNLEAVHAFQKRKIQGMGLSERVWEISKQAKKEMELAMDVALSDGRSAATLSRDIRHLLREPNKLFRRVRDKHGNLQLSKAAQAYHPGQGVYRSSARNAQRLARTEINMAYHEADSQYWSGSDIVLGIEIVLSNNHPIEDICDEFEGKQFPKWFKFTGWHPQCRCVAVPITPKREEMIDYLKRMARGEDVSNYNFSGVVTDLPDEFKQWMTDNADRLEGMRQRGKLPYFVKENFGEYYEGASSASAMDAIKSDGVREAIRQTPPDTPITDKEAENIIMAFAQDNKELFGAGLNEVAFKELKNGAMMGSLRYTNGTNSIHIDTRTHFVTGLNGETIEYVPSVSLKNALYKIRNGEKLLFEEEYSIESVWHEILHCGARRWDNPVLSRNAEYSTIVESINQLTARRSYNQFLSSLGGKSRYKEQVLEMGFGYRRAITNTRIMLNQCGIDEDAFVNKLKVSLMNKPYDDMREISVNMLSSFGVNRRLAYEYIKNLNSSTEEFLMLDE